MNKKEPFFDRSQMRYFPLTERLSKVDIPSACVSSDAWPPVEADLEEKAGCIAEEILEALKAGAAVICAFGAHSIKNGLGKLLGDFLNRGWFTHLAANGAAVIHDWEFAFLGKSSEDVRENVAAGRFGTWEETGLYINLALAVGAYEGLGYGASVGKMITQDGLAIPEQKELLAAATLKPGFFPEEADKAAAALDLYELLEYLKIPPGFLPVSHAYKSYSLLAAAAEARRPMTCHPMFGHDIIYTHKANRGAAIGRTAERDFLEFVSSVANLEGGVYLSVGSAVMSPMIFEKALSMARNAAGGKGITRCCIHVTDLQEATWDWSKGEPSMDNPAYYLRFMKTFSRMGCKADYTSADNRDFFVALYRALAEKSA
jgi:hypothetical protein